MLIPSDEHALDEQTAAAAEEPSYRCALLELLESLVPPRPSLAIPDISCVL